MTAQEGEGWGGISILTNMFGISVNIDFKYETSLFINDLLIFDTKVSS